MVALVEHGLAGHLAEAADDDVADLALGVRADHLSDRVNRIHPWLIIACLTRV